MRYSIFSVVIFILIFYPIDKTNLFAQTSAKDTTNNTWYFSVTLGKSTFLGSDNIGGAAITLRRNNLSISSAGGGRDDKKGAWGYFGVSYNQFDMKFSHSRVWMQEI